MWRFATKLNEVLLLNDYGLNPQKSQQFGIPWHNGIDISIGDHDPVYCFVYSKNLKVSRVNPFLFDEGTVVIINEEEKVEYVFAHLDNLQVKEGDLVNFNTYLGNQDSKGQSVQEQLKPFWQHLHFSVREIDDINGQLGRLWPYGRKYKNIDNGLDGFIDPNKYCLRVLFRVAEAVAQIESGYNVLDKTFSPNAKIAKENNNPGNLRWSPFAVGTKNGFAVFETLEKGFQALLWDLEQKAKGNTTWSKLGPNSTILDFCKIYAPQADNNNPEIYAQNIVKICGFKSINDKIGDWLLTELDYVRKYSNINDIEKSYSFGYGIKLLVNFFWNLLFKDKK